MDGHGVTLPQHCLSVLLQNGKHKEPRVSSGYNMSITQVSAQFHPDITRKVDIVNSPGLLVQPTPRPLAMLGIHSAQLRHNHCLPLGHQLHLIRRDHVCSGSDKVLWSRSWNIIWFCPMTVSRRNSGHQFSSWQFPDSVAPAANSPLYWWDSPSWLHVRFIVSVWEFLQQTCTVVQQITFLPVLHQQKIGKHEQQDSN
jgi:hypothetical protein